MFTHIFANYSLAYLIRLESKASANVNVYLHAKGSTACISIVDYPIALPDLN